MRLARFAHLPDLVSGPGLLQRRLAALLTVFSVALLLAVNLAWLPGALRQVHTAQSELQQVAARSARDQIHRFLEDKRDHLLAEALLFREPYFDRDMAEVRRLTQRLFLRNPVFTEISILDSAGREGFRFSQTQMYTPQDFRDRSTDPLFVDAVQAGAAWGPVIVAATAVPSVTIAVRLRRTEREGVAVLVGVLTLQSLWELTAESRLANGGRVFVVDRQGRLIAAEDANLVLKQLSFANRPLIQQLTEAHPNGPDLPVTGDYVNEHGVPVRATGLVVSGTGWAVVVEQPESLFTAPVRRTLYFAFCLVVVGIAGSLWLARMMSRRFTEPISRLGAEVRAFGAGQLDRRVTVTTSDEIGDLGRQFNQMAEALAASYQGLEAKVAERTRALSTLFTTAREAVSVTNLDEVLSIITRSAAGLLECRASSVRLLDRQTNTLTLVADTNPDDEFRQRGPMPAHEGVTGQVLQTGQPVVVEDVATHPRFYYRDVTLRAGIRSVALAPLRAHEEIVGVLNVYDARPRHFSEAEVSLLTEFANLASLALEKARLFEAQRRAYEELRQTQEELVRSEKLRALGQMAAGVAHDLNNILAVILGQAELLQVRMPLPEIQESLQLLCTAATDGAQVVRRLQEFSRQQASAGLHRCNLATIVREAAELTRPRWHDEAHQQGRLIQIDTALNGQPLILGNPPEIREVLTNLIFNALDAMPTGGTLRFRLIEDPPADPSPGAGTVCLSVSDTGIGMAEDVQRRIFEPFFTTKGFQGTGLGLAVAYGIMERHGGRIDVRSAPGEGTTFLLRFQSAAEAARTPDAGVKTARASRRVLLIDDDASVRETIADLLRMNGHSATEVESGQEGLTWLAAHPVDVVITDLGMPHMTGWEVAAQVKAHHAVPVILLTGWGQHTSDAADGARAVDAVLAKPIQAEDLHEAIARLTGDGPATTPA